MQGRGAGGGQPSGVEVDAGRGRPSVMQVEALEKKAAGEGALSHMWRQLASMQRGASTPSGAAVAT